MKKIILPILLLASGISGWSAEADASKVAPPVKMESTRLPPTNSVPFTETDIISKRASFDMKTSTIIYQGDVRIKDPRMDLSCEVLTVKLAPEGGGKIESSIAETNVVIDFIDEKGQRIHATGGKVIYRYTVTPTSTNDVMELMDNPLLHTSEVDWSGGVISFDRINNTVKGDHSRVIIRQPAGTTNSPILGPTN